MLNKDDMESMARLFDVAAQPKNIRQATEWHSMSKDYALYAISQNYLEALERE